MTIKAVNTGSLEALIIDAARRDYNRQIDLTRFDRHVDPDGIHLLRDVIVHGQKGGKRCEPHMRCQVFIKVKNETAPVIAWLDVEMKQFVKLHDAPRIEDVKTEVV